MRLEAARDVFGRSRGQRFEGEFHPNVPIALLGDMSGKFIVHYFERQGASALLNVAQSNADF